MMTKSRTFEDFIKSGKRNAWIAEPGIVLFVRKSLPSRGTDYDLAAMTADNPGNKALTRFLDKYELKYSFYIENVLQPNRLGKYFLKRKYRDVTPPDHKGAPRCYQK